MGIVKYKKNIYANARGGLNKQDVTWVGKNNDLNSGVFFTIEKKCGDNEKGSLSGNAYT